MKQDLDGFCVTRLALLVVALIGHSACSGGSDSGMGGGEGSLAVSFGGPWEGTWSAQALAPSPVDSTALGTLTLQLDQVGKNVTGTATFVGHPCLETCTISCEVNGHEMSGWFQAGSGQMMFSGNCPESDHCAGPHHADTLSATYVIQDGPCEGEVGVIQMMPVVSDQGAPEVHAVQVGELILVDQTNGNLIRMPVFRPHWEPDSQAVHRSK